MTKTRTETDTFGPIEVDSSRYWGAQAQRSLGNFKIGWEKQPAPIVRALGIVKRAAAETNMALGNLDKAIGSSPAALLAGADDVDKYFSLNAIGVKKKLDWLEVKPYDENSLFEKVRMGFRGNMLESMELHDHFGQKTTIKFSNLQRNPKSDPGLYTFSVPTGADVVTE